MYAALDVARVYTKSPTKKEPDYDKPYTLRRGSTLLDVADTRWLVDTEAFG